MMECNRVSFSEKKGRIDRIRRENPLVCNKQDSISSQVVDGERCCVVGGASKGVLTSFGIFFTTSTMVSRA